MKQLIKLMWTLQNHLKQHVCPLGTVHLFAPQLKQGLSQSTNFHSSSLKLWKVLFLRDKFFLAEVCHKGLKPWGNVPQNIKPSQQVGVARNSEHPTATLLQHAQLNLQKSSRDKSSSKLSKSWLYLNLKRTASALPNKYASVPSHLQCIRSGEQCKPVRPVTSHNATVRAQPVKRFLHWSGVMIWGFRALVIWYKSDLWVSHKWHGWLELCPGSRSHWGCHAKSHCNCQTVAKKPPIQRPHAKETKKNTPSRH